MRRELQQQDHHPDQRHDRKEWGRHGDDGHQLEAREHARTPGKSHKTHGIRSDEAARQIRELRSRY